MAGETVDRMSDELCVERIDQMRAHLEKVLASPILDAIEPIVAHCELCSA